YRTKAAKPARQVEAGGNGKLHEKYVNSQGIPHNF
ncbi:hypothetical protein JCM10207_003279, partial [Rhodosporidiobolus poonsookiae]